MNTKFVVGLTGGIGSGKTTVSDWFFDQGINIVDADVIARQIVEKDSPTLQKIAQYFGDWVLTPEGQFDRLAMRKFVFHNSNALVALESITHPAIRAMAKQQLALAKSPYVILSAPLLLEASEAGLANLCNRILVVDVPESLQLTRASQRDGQDINQIKAIMNNQLSRESRLKQADDVISNQGDLTDLYPQLAHLHQTYLALSQTSE